MNSRMVVTPPLAEASAWRSPTATIRPSLVATPPWNSPACVTIRPPCRSRSAFMRPPFLDVGDPPRDARPLARADGDRGAPPHAAGPDGAVAEVARRVQIDSARRSGEVHDQRPDRM